MISVDDFITELTHFIPEEYGNTSPMGWVKIASPYLPKNTTDHMKIMRAMLTGLSHFWVADMIDAKNLYDHVDLINAMGDLVDTEDKRETIVDALLNNSRIVYFLGEC